MKEILEKYFIGNDKNGTLRKYVRSRKLKVTDQRVIDYDSPTGKGFVGIAKSPLQKVEDGFGFKGVLMQTDNRTLCQCHICGKWFRLLAKHIEKLHQTTRDQYCKQFGLNASNGLVPDEYSYIRERAMRKVWENSAYKIKHTKRLRQQQSKAIKSSLKKRLKSTTRTVEQENEHGTCELQIKYRLVEYIKRYKDLPSRSTKGEGGRICKVLRTRHGSLNEGFKAVGLPVRYRQGTSVELVAPDKAQLFFNYNKVYNKNEIYGWLEEHCPVLKETNTLLT